MTWMIWGYPHCRKSPFVDSFGPNSRGPSEGEHSARLSPGLWALWRSLGYDWHALLRDGIWDGTKGSKKEGWTKTKIGR